MSDFVIPPPPVDSFIQLEALVRRYRALGAEKSEIDAEMKELQSQVSELTQPGWKMIVDNVPASHREANRVFSLPKALSILTVEQKTECIDREPRFDPKLIRKCVEDAGVLEDCMEIDESRSSVVKLS